MRNIWNDDEEDGIGVMLKYILKYVILICGIIFVIALLVKFFQFAFPTGG